MQLQVSEQHVCHLLNGSSEQEVWLRSYPSLKFSDDNEVCMIHEMSTISST